MKNDNIFNPTSNIVHNCHVDKATYEQMYKESISSPDIFWNNHGKRITNNPNPKINKGN